MHLKFNLNFFRKIFLCATLSGCFWHSSFGQVLKFDFDEYNTKDGLSHNSITCITQDSSGFMWFGTEEGLNRFDGHDFKIYKHIEGDSNSLVSSDIQRLFFDEADGSIWIGTSNGVNQFYPRTNKIIQYPIDFVDETKLNGAYVNSIKKRKDGSIWIAYIGSGVDVIRPGTKEVLHYTIHRNDQYKLKSDMVGSLEFMGDYTLLGSYDGLELIGSTGAVLTHEEAIKIYPWMSEINGDVKLLYKSKAQPILWIGTEVNGLYKVNLLNNKVRNYTTANSELESDDILSIYEDSQGRIWVGSDAIYYYDPNGETLVWYKEDGMYIKNHTHAIFEDRDSNLWLGTVRLGIRKISIIDEKVSHFHSNQGEGSVKSDEILSFNQDATGQVWVGTGGAGLVKFIEKSGTFEDSPINSLLYSKVIKCIYEDKQGNFWMGGWDAGLVKYNPVTGDFKQYHPSNKNFDSHHIWDIAEDQQGNLWLGSLRDGLIRFSPKNETWQYYNYMPGDSTALVNDDVISVLVDSRDMLWAGTGNGLSVLFPGSETFVNLFEFKTNAAYSLSNNVILTIAEDAKGRIWLGTKGGGIILIRVIDNKLVVEKVLKEEDGLPNNIINAIQQEDDHHFWISTSNGLSKIDIDTFEVLATNHIAGLQGNEYIAQANFKTEDGTLLFGGSRGFQAFDPDSLNLNPLMPPVFFTSLKIINDYIEPNKEYRGRKIIDKRITEMDELVLSHEDYAVTLGFSCLTYNRQKSIKYTYFLENFDKEWQYTDEERRFAHYTNLPAGEYKLYVKASFDGLNWPDEARVLKIKVTPPWYGVIWFKLGVVAVLLFAIGGSFVGRDKFLQKQRNKLEHLVDLRTTELERSNKEIQMLLEEVAAQKNKIEIKNRELQIINEKVGAQRDSLERKSNELENMQYKLQETNSNLETLVNKRTEILNNTLHELESFLYRASHDLQGPISTMKGLLALADLETKTLPEKSKSDYPPLFEGPVLKLEGTLKKLLQKHAIQKLNISLEPFNQAVLSSFLCKIVSDIKAFRKDDLEVVIEDNVEFESDKAMLTIILHSLLENAFFYSQHAENRKVCLTFSKCARNIVITVTDHGIGIRSAHQEKIFTKFYRGSELSKGNGLGLYLLKNVLEKVNGTIEVKSEEGHYTKFVVVIPA